jgi:hypothetical protein
MQKGQPFQLACVTLSALSLRGLSVGTVNTMRRPRGLTYLHIILPYLTQRPTLFHGEISDVSVQEFELFRREGHRDERNVVFLGFERLGRRLGLGNDCTINPSCLCKFHIHQNLFSG